VVQKPAAKLFNRLFCIFELILVKGAFTVLQYGLYVHESIRVCRVLLCALDNLIRIKAITVKNRKKKIFFFSRECICRGIFIIVSLL